MANIRNIIKDRTVDIYDSNSSVAKALRASDPRRIRLFTRDEPDDNVQIEGVSVHQQLKASAASLSRADVCLLDHSALKVLAVRYPSDVQVLLVRIAFRRAWVLGFLGLVRRLVLGRVKMGGVVRIRDTRKHSTYWLVIKRKKITQRNSLVLPKRVGAEVFFAWMHTEGISYVVPRFYEQLPELHREDGDLDLLVADEDAQKVESYLRKHMRDPSDTSVDNIPIGLHTVTRTDGVPYYPPPIATRILERAIAGPAGSRIPDPVDALHALIYHVLYHGKGYATNIPSTLGGTPENPPENDYGSIIQRQARELGISVGETMEDMDEYMTRVGWQPKRDTLAKVSERNAWARDRFFGVGSCDTTGLTVYILKERALERGLMEDIVAHLRENGLVVIRDEILTEEQKRRASEDVRGGNWAGTNGTIAGFLPAAIVIAVDPQCISVPGVYAAEYERTWAKRRKQRLREVFDEPGEASLVHAADNTSEAWEYVETCLPDEVDAIREEVMHAAHAPLLLRWRRRLSPSYALHAIRATLRDFVTHKLL